MTSPLANNRGVALLTTLLVLVFMVVITLNFGSVIRRNLTGAAYSMTRIDLQQRARSTVSLASSVLYADQKLNHHDSLLDHWANQPWLKQQADTLFDDGAIDLTIDDHSGRLQVNALITAEGAFEPEQKNRFMRLLTSEEIRVSPEEAGQILDAIKDWLDPDDDITEFGAENSWYQTLAAPYSCRNGPIASIDELLLVRGISDELLYGTEVRPGIAQFFTPYGTDGLVNINTANSIVLRTLSEGIDQATVEALLAYRTDHAHDLASTDWYKSVYGDLHIPMITVNSSFFEIRIQGNLRNVTIGALAMMYRPHKPALPENNPLPPIMISWQVE